MKLFLVRSITGPAHGLLGEFWETLKRTVDGPGDNGLTRTFFPGEKPFGKWYRLPKNGMWVGTDDFGFIHLFQQPTADHCQDEELTRTCFQETTSRGYYVSKSDFIFESPNTFQKSKHTITSKPLEGGSVKLADVASVKLSQLLKDPPTETCSASVKNVDAPGNLFYQIHHYNILFQINFSKAITNTSGTFKSQASLRFPTRLDDGKCDGYFEPEYKYGRDLY